MNALQKILTVNTLFSGVSGILIILLNQQIAYLFGTNNNTVFWIVGIGLIYFSITIWYDVKKQRKLAVLWIIIQDFLWVIGSLVLVIVNPFQISYIGSLVIGVIGIIVLALGISQTVSLNLLGSKKD